MVSRRLSSAVRTSASSSESHSSGADGFSGRACSGVSVAKQEAQVGVVMSRFVAPSRHRHDHQVLQLACRPRLQV